MRRPSAPPAARAPAGSKARSAPLPGPPMCPPPPGHQALVALGCMEHRGACSADDVSGDGAGLMTRIPWALFNEEVPGVDEAHTG